MTRESETRKPKQSQQLFCVSKANVGRRFVDGERREERRKSEGRPRTKRERERKPGQKHAWACQQPARILGASGATP